MNTGKEINLFISDAVHLQVNSFDPFCTTKSSQSCIASELPSRNNI